MAVVPLGPMARNILTHLMDKKTISGIEASALYRCRDLPKRISEIKQAGYKVTTEYRRDRTGQRYAHYTIVRRRTVKEN